MMSDAAYMGNFASLAIATRGLSSLRLVGRLADGGRGEIEKAGSTQLVDTRQLV